MLVNKGKDELWSGRKIDHRKKHFESSNESFARFLRDAFSRTYKNV